MDAELKRLPEGVLLTPLRIIAHPQGDVLHAMKRSDPGFVAFGEAYFSTVKCGEVKGWKRHRRMTLNLVVPEGAVRFVLRDDREESATRGLFAEVTLSRSGYRRLTVPPGLWMAFQGIGRDLNLLLNLADLEHDPEESDKASIEAIPFDWRLP